jgi:hypothetical protein
MDGRDRVDEACKLAVRSNTMSRRAEDWLAEQEVALLEAINQLESPPDPVDRKQPTRLEAQTGRVLKSRVTE